MIKSIEEFLRSKKLNNILQIITVLVSIIALFKVNSAEQMINELKIERDGYIQNAEIINNSGASAEDIDYLSDKNINEAMDNMYAMDDIIKMVDNNPHLSFSIIWRGTEEDYENINYDEMPPGVTYYIQD